nr:hypothetical protein [Tanacetum cinerariifolium]
GRYKEIAKIDEPEDTEGDEDDDKATKSDRESEDEETREQEEESFDQIPRTPKESEDEGNDEDDQDLRLVSQDIDDSHVTLTPVNPDGLQESSSVSSFVTSMLNPISDTGVESIFMTASSPIVSLQTPTPIMTPSTIATITTSRDAPIPPTTIPSIILENLPTFNSAFRFDERLKSLETTFSEYRQTNPFVDAVSAIPGIVHQYMTQKMTEAVREAVQIQTDRLQDSFQRENYEFLRNIDENMKQIIKGQVKSQVKEQVLRILPRIEEFVNATLEVEVLTRSSNSSRTSYAIATDLSEMELKKILIEKMEGNKSIQWSDEQRNLYKALVESCDADKTILDTYGESTILKRRREDDDQEGPSAGSDWGSKRKREGGEHASASTPSETATGSASRSATGSQSRQLSASESAFAEEPVQTTCQMEELSHPVFETGAEDQPSLDWLNPGGQQYPHNLLQPLPLIPDNQGRRVIPFEHFINNDLEYLRGGASSRKYTTSVNKTKAADYGHIKWIEDLVPRAMWIQEAINYDRHTLWGVSHWGRKHRGSKRLREGGEHASASTSSETATASEYAFAEEPVQTICQMEEPPYPVFETGADDQPIVQTSQHPECLTELEYHLEEVYKATTDQLDWVNPEGQQYPHNLLQPLPLIPDNRGRRVIPFEHFINNDLEYLRGGASSRKYTTSVTKTKAADYGHIKWIEDLVPRAMWIQEPINYDRHALWGVSHWERKRQQFYGFAVNRESALDVYSKRRIIAVTELKIMEWHDYKHLDWISVRRDDDKIYKFKKGDFKRLHIQDIEDMLLLLVQGKLSNLTVDERFAFNVS